MRRVRLGDPVVVGHDGVGVQAPPPPQRSSGMSPFEFMTSEVSSEKPKGLLVAEVSDRIRRAKAAGGRVLAVCGPARSEEHTSELQSRQYLVCRVLLEKQITRE